MIYQYFLAHQPQTLALQSQAIEVIDDFKLKEILSELQKIKHIKIIRINTRIPVTIPSRITDDLVQMLSQISGLFINIHFEHPDEIDEYTFLRWEPKRFGTFCFVTLI